MKAMVNMRYGSPDVLELTEVDKPIPKDDEALVKVHAASVNPADWHLREARRESPACNSGCANRSIGFWGAMWQVEAVGKNVTMLQPGDDVFGSPFVHGFGAFAQCVCVSEELLVPKLATLAFEQAAAVPLAASTALQGLRDHGRIESGQKS
jgi:NADPH:quinone reductase-like Zn-dependent oxidoreductase